jgi:DNA-binding IclR family transcriptional regulator
MERGFDVLETLALSPLPLSLAEVARSLGRTSSELFRTLTVLEGRGYIQREEVSGKYGLTLRLFALAHSHSPVEKFLRAAALPMQRLTEQVRESCHLCILDHNRLIVLAQAESPARYRFSVELGSTFSPLHTTSGRLLLANLSEEQFRNYCAVDGDYQALTAAQKKTLHTELAEIRRKGYSTARDVSAIGMRDVSVLVGNPSVGLTAALAIAFLASRGKKDPTRQLLAAARESAAAITQNLGLTM